jgi:NAD(P)-dependent dehydrogenase (short-subunit alcohol dehydrogenase family)
VIVTGAAGNVGRAVVARLAARHARIVGVDREAAALAAALDGRENCAAVSGVDLADPHACASVVAQAIERFGRVDGLVHTVGGFVYAKAAESDAALFERMFRLNVITTLNMVQACLKPMRGAGRGSIVAIAAAAALRAPSGMSAYAASKSAVIRLVESFAEEFKATGIRLNAVLPTIVDTPENRADMPKADTATWIAPDELAAVIEFLISDGASAVTGAALPVAGRV